MTTNESTEPSVPSDGEIYSRASFPNEDYRQGFLEGLRTLAALPPGPAASPLFWRKATDHPQDPDKGWVADGLSGRYTAEKQRDGSWLLWWAHDNFIWEACSTFAEAKEKAEADWQKRFVDRLATPHPCSVAGGGWLGPQISARLAALSQPATSREAVIGLIRAEMMSGDYPVSEWEQSFADKILSLAPAPAAGVEILSPEDAWQDLLDKDDRTSPEEYPDMALITLDELRDYMTAGLPTLPDGDPDRTACDGPAGGGVFAHPALRAAQVRESGS